jgi:hypothetical protein
LVGIDFSGNRAQWKPSARSSNIWIAVVEDHDDQQTLTSLQRVQQLPGQGRPFARLADWLARGDYSAAAIDAPFSVPWWFFGRGCNDHPGLLEVVNQLPLEDTQDFPTGKAFVAALSGAIPFPFTKPLRVTESYWQGRGVNTRSAVWSGARPGAPFASACIKLLAGAARPVWPWASAERSPLLEAFPAAQLRHWGLPHVRYNGPSGQGNREAIVADLLTNRGLQASDAFQAVMQADADALDAVLSCYAARAVMRRHLAAALPPFDAWRLEGWIAVHQ